jgi:hypothetical protein
MPPKFARQRIFLAPPNQLLQVTAEDQYKRLGFAGEASVVASGFWLSIETCLKLNL